MSRRGAPKLPRLSESQVLEMLREGRYRVCRRTGEVTGPGGKVITPFAVGSRRFVRVYGFGGVRVITLARLVWMSVTLEVIPPGYEVHHRDEVCQNDGWDNLIALHKLDHRKVHYDSAPF